MSESNTTSYQWRTSARRVVAAIESVERSKAPLFEFGLEGDAAEAAREAADLGWLDFVANGVVQITDTGRAIVMQKDPVAHAMNIVALRQMFLSRKTLIQLPILRAPDAAKNGAEHTEMLRSLMHQDPDLIGPNEVRL